MFTTLVLCLLILHGYVTNLLQHKVLLIKVKGYRRQNF